MIRMIRIHGIALAVPSNSTDPEGYGCSVEGGGTG